ncbi:hypothetical protein ACOMHN_063231 [Nucella lapillus]
MKEKMLRIKEYRSSRSLQSTLWPNKPCHTLSASSAPSFNRALEDGFGQRIVAIHMAKPCKLAAFCNG